MGGGSSTIYYTANGAGGGGGALTKVAIKRGGNDQVYLVAAGGGGGSTNDGGGGSPATGGTGAGVESVAGGNPGYNTALYNTFQYYGGDGGVAYSSIASATTRKGNRGAGGYYGAGPKWIGGNGGASVSPDGEGAGGYGGTQFIPGTNLSDSGGNGADGSAKINVYYIIPG